MKKINIMKPLFLGISFTLILLFVFKFAANGAPAKELDLNPTGTVYETRRDANGNLWISDYGEGEIWQVNAAGTVYTIYEGLHGASDAHGDNLGNVWYSNYDDNTLGKLTLGTSTAVTYPLSGPGNALGISIDGTGNVWATDSSESLIYRFNPITTQRCNFTVPISGSSEYIQADNGFVWIGDYVGGNILRLNTSTNEYTIWSLTSGAYPRGLDVDEEGNLWWADADLTHLGRLEPGANRITTYTVPIGFSSPNNVTVEGRKVRGDNEHREPNLVSALAMVDYHHGRVWYTDEESGLFGRLDPALASGTSTVVTPSTSSVTPSCSTLGAGNSVAINVTTSATSWVDTVYTETLNSGGWRQYQLPVSPLGGFSWGVAASDGNVWVADQGRQKLGWSAFDECYFLTTGHTGMGSDPTASPTSSTSCDPGQFTAGSVISFTAVPNSGWTVTGWSGTDDDTSTSTQNTATMPAVDHTVSVDYEQCFALTLNHTGSGSNPVATPSNSDGCDPNHFLAGEDINLTAAPATNWTVTGWTGTDDDNSTSTQNTLTMPAMAHTASVHYGQCHLLTLSHTGSGGDPVASPTSSNGCSSGRYLAGEDIDLTAAPATNWTVIGWTGTDDDNSTSTQNTLTMPAGNHTASVHYGQCHLLTLSHTGSGSDPVATPGNSNGCSTGRYLEGEDIDLTATPATNWTVTGWTGTDDDNSTSTQNSVTMPSGDHTATVHYGQCHVLTLAHTGNGADPVAVPGNSDGCSSGRYVAGEVIDLTADPDNGWEVASWNGTDDDGSTSTQNTATMPDGDHTVTVNYIMQSVVDYSVYLPLVLK